MQNKSKYYPKPRKPTYKIRDPQEPHKTLDEDLISRIFLIAQSGDLTKLRDEVSQNHALLNIKDADDNSLIHVVLANSNIKKDDKYQIIKYLVDHNVSVTVPNKNNVRPIHIASNIQDKNIIELLINHGSQVNYVDNSGRNALHYAVDFVPTKCKPIIHNIKSISHNNIKGDIEYEMKKMTRVIIDVLYYNENVNYLLKHIFSTIQNIPNMYPLDIETKIENYHEAIMHIISNREGMVQQEKERKDAVFKKDIETFIKSKLKNSKTNLTIKSSTQNRWGPGNKASDRILNKSHKNHLDDLTLKYQNDMANILDINKNDSIYNLGKTTAGQLNKLKSNVNEIINNVHDVISHNNNLYQNRFTYLYNTPTKINDKMFAHHNISQFFVHHYSENLVYNELTVDGISPLLEPFTMIDISNLNEVRGTVSDRKKWGDTSQKMRMSYDQAHHFVGKDEKDALNNATKMWKIAFDTTNRRIMTHIVELKKNGQSEIKLSELFGTISQDLYPVDVPLQLELIYHLFDKSVNEIHNIFHDYSKKKDTTKGFININNDGELNDIINTIIMLFIKPPINIIQNVNAIVATLNDRELKDNQTALDKITDKLKINRIKLFPGFTGQISTIARKRITFLYKRIREVVNEFIKINNNNKKYNDVNIFIPLPETVNESIPGQILSAPYMEMVESQPNNVKYYFTTKLKFYTHRIDNYKKIIENNIETMIYFLDKSNYHYEIYHRLITANIVSIISIFMIFDKIPYELTSILTTLYTVKDDYKEKQSNHIKHPYAYEYGYILSNLDEAIKNTKNMKDTLNNAYVNLLKLVNKMNNIIEIINKHSSQLYIMNYHYENKSQVTDKIDNFYSRPIEPINFQDFPSDINKFSEFVKNLDIDKKRIKLIEHFFPIIYRNNFTYYHMKQNLVNIDKDIFILSMGEDGKIKSDVAYHSADEYREETIHPTIGYLLNNNNIPNLEIIDQREYPDNNKKQSDKVQLNLEDGHRTNGTIGLSGPISFNKSKSAPLSIREYLNDHIVIIRHKIIQEVVTVFYNSINNNDERKYKYAEASLKSEAYVDDDGDQTGGNKIDENIKKSYISQKEILIDPSKINFPEEFVNSSIYINVGKIVDELVNEHIDNSIQRSSINFVKTLSKQNNSNIIMEKLTVQDVDEGFKKKIPKLFNDIADLFISRVSANNDTLFDALKHSANVIKSKNQDSNDSDPYEIYDIDFKNKQIERKCTKNKQSIIEFLLNKGVDPKHQNNDGQTPLMSALDLQHNKVCKKIINNISHISNDNSPLQYQLNNFERHNELINNNGLTKPFYKDVVSVIKEKPEYENMVIKHLDIMFEQLLVMYNGVLSSQLDRYVGGWSKKNQNNLNDLLINFGIINNETTKRSLPMFDLTNDEFDFVLGQNSNLHVLAVKDDQLDKESNEQQKNLGNIKRKIESYEHDQKNITDIVVLNNINKMLGILEDDEKYNYDNDQESKQFNLNKNIKNRVQHKRAFFRKRIKSFRNFYKENRNMPGSINSTNIWDYIFHFVVNNNEISDNIDEIEFIGNEDFYAYNNLWKTYLDNTHKLKNYNSIHLLLSNAEKNIIKSLKENKSDENYKNNLNNLEIINDVYNKVLIDAAKNFQEMPEYYSFENNYMLYYSINIIIHLTKYTLCSNFYFSILKAITAYVIERNPKEINKGNTMQRFSDKKSYQKYLINLIKNIVNFGDDHNSNYKLEKYIMNKFAKRAVKFSLQIYESEDDSDKNTKSFNELMLPIIEILKENNKIELNDNSSLIKKINEYIFPYYEDVMQKSIKNMHTLIQNYNKYILVSGRHLELTTMILNKII